MKSIRLPSKMAVGGRRTGYTESGGGRKLHHVSGRKKKKAYTIKGPFWT